MVIGLKITHLAFFRVILFLLLISATIIFFSVIGLFIKKDEFSDSSVVGVSATSPITIIIDAGHGGEDGGAVANGVVEKDINLAIAKSLRAYIETSNLSYDMTREEDVLLYNDHEKNNKKRYDLLNRIKIGNSYHSAIFISIHQNKFEIPKYKGLQVYYSVNNHNSEKIAALIQCKSKIYLDNDNNRETKPADYRIKVLDSLQIPAVLVECGFLSNPEEAELLSDKNYQNRIALIIYLSIVEFLENNGEL